MSQKTIAASTQNTFHNQVVGVGVVAGLGLAVNLALHKVGFFALFLVDGKIPLMAAVGVHTVQVRPIGVIAQLALHFTYQCGVFFLKHFGVFAVAPIIAVGIVDAVLVHLVDKKQAQHLDAAGVQLALALQVGAYGFAYLHAALQLHHLGVAVYLPCVKLQSVQKGDRVIPPVNAVLQNDKAVSVFLQAAGQRKQIVAALHFFDHGAGAACALDLKPQPCGGGFVFVQVNALYIHIAVGGGGAGQRNAQRGNALDKVLVVGVHRVQTVDHIIGFAVGGRVAQREQRVELFQALFGLLALNALRLVNNQDRVGFGNDVNRSAAAEGIQRFVNNALVFAGVERLHT